MRHWLTTRAEEERTKQEEERRRQEEERSRQESLKLEQRLIEQAMLRESMQGGVPAHMIPIIFAGIGGPSLVTASVELVQQYAAQLQQHDKAVVEPLQEQHPDNRATNPPQYFVSNQQIQSAQQHNPQIPFPAFAPARTAPTSAPRPASALSRLNTIDIAQPAGPVMQHPEQGVSASPSIYFHHWVPPNTQDAKPVQAPTPQSRADPPSAPPSFAGDVEMRDSPRMRKATGGHGPIPPPSQTSPTYSSHSSTRSRGDSSVGRVRSRSVKSNDEMVDAGRQAPSRRDSVATQQHRMSVHGYSHDAAHRMPGNRGSQYIR